MFSYRIFYTIRDDPMYLLMKILLITVVGLGALAGLLFVVLFIDDELGYQEDLKACSDVTPDQVVVAVVQDVTRADSHIFARFHLHPGDVSVDRDSIQIGPSSVLAPFRIAAEPACQYFAMPRCYVLSSIE